MANENKHRILKELQNSSDWLSGEDISRQLGISRVAVWKQIKSMSEKGYTFLTGPKGYRLIEQEDPLTDLEFAEEEEILYFQELRSTMDEAQRQIQNPKQKKGSFTILTEHQSAGISREETNWDSPSGGIYLTFVLKGELASNNVVELKKKGILAVLQTLKSEQISSLHYRESGDILVGPNKIAGMLEEYQVRGNKLLWFSLGIGVYLNSHPNGALGSLRQLTDKRFKRSLIVKKLKNHWEELLSLSINELELKLQDFQKLN